MDIKKTLDEIIDKVKNDDNLKKEFMAAPIPTVEKLVGVDLPDDKIKELVEAIKAKITIDDIGSVLGGLGGLFGKKN